MPSRPATAYGLRMESTPPAFGAPQLFLSDARLYLGIANHLRYDALRWAFGVNREQANVVTVLLVLGTVESVYEGARRIPGMRPSISGIDAAIGAVALRDAALGAVGGPAGREIPGFATLVAGAALATLAIPSLRRAAARARAAEQRMRAAEARIRSERIRRYQAARERVRAAAG
jgi:hypothetical protein